MVAMAARRGRWWGGGVSALPGRVVPSAGCVLSTHRGAVDGPRRRRGQVPRVVLPMERYQHGTTGLLHTLEGTFARESTRMVRPGRQSALRTGGAMKVLDSSWFCKEHYIGILKPGKVYLLGILC